MRAVAALLLAGAIFGAVNGAAATLGTGTSLLGAGNASVASCETGTVTGSPHVRAGGDGYVVDIVTLTGLDASCSGKTVSVTLTGASGTSALASFSGVVPPGGGDVSLTDSTPVDAAAVSGVSVAIQG